MMVVTGFSCDLREECQAGRIGREQARYAMDMNRLDWLLWLGGAFLLLAFGLHFYEIYTGQPGLFTIGGRPR